MSIYTVFTHAKKSLQQNELLGCLSEDIKMWQSHNMLNWYTINWLRFNIYVDHGLNYKE